MARKIIFFTMFLSFLLPAESRGLDYTQSWFDCTSSKECDMAFNYCGEAEGVNSRYKAKAQMYFDMTPYHCRMRDKPKPGDPDWDAWLTDERGSLRCESSKCIIPEQKKFRAPQNVA